jgi:hypothetical protein
MSLPAVVKRFASATTLDELPPPRTVDERFNIGEQRQAEQWCERRQLGRNPARVDRADSRGRRNASM